MSLFETAGAKALTLGEQEVGHAIALSCGRDVHRLFINLQRLLVEKHVESECFSSFSILFLSERLSLKTFKSMRQAGAEFGEDDHGGRDAEEVEDEETQHALQHEPENEHELIQLILLH